MNAAADFKRANTFDFINTEIDRNTAWVTYRLSSAITKESKEITTQWLETVFLNKQKKQWRVKHLHSTLIKNNIPIRTN